MDILLKTETIVWCVFVILLGLMVGSFLNVLIARLPFEKSVIWPGSRCFSCLQPIHWADNLPILGYLRRGGKCAKCGSPFSSSYLWVEAGTAVAFLALFLVEVVYPIHKFPAAKPIAAGLPPLGYTVLFLYHSVLVSLLIAAAVIDARHRIIPTIIPYTGAIVGIVGGALMPWPWPFPASALAPFQASPTGQLWQLTEWQGKVPMGVQLWPFWGPPPKFAPAASWQLGLLNSVLGALVGTFVVRGVKWLFEVGFGNEALGMGDADLMLMAGAFLGWQPVLFSLFVGAFAALIVFKLPSLVMGYIRGAPIEHELPFGPGLAVGVVVTLLGWRWIGPEVQFPFFDPPAMLIMTGVLSVGMLAAGLLLRKNEDPAPVPEAVTKS